MKVGQITRVGFLSIAVLFVASVIVCRLFFVQVVRGNLYRQEANDQYVAHTENGRFDRGSIFFQERDGTLISAATLTTGYTLAINPSVLKDVSGAYDKLSVITPLDKKTFLFRANKKTDPYEEISKHLDDVIAKKIRALDIEGIGIYEEKWRSYPGGNLASHVLGFVGYEGDSLGGRYGLEKYYDDVLKRGENKLYVNFFAEVFANISTAISTNNKNNRLGDVVTSIEPTVQEELQEQLRGIQEKYRTESVGGIIIDPKTGEIYAMAALPDFDPNSYNTASSTNVFTNPLVEKAYEMGSTIKPLTMAIGLDTGAVTAATTYNDKGTVVIEGSRLNNYDFKARGVVPMQEVLNQSLNTGVVFVEQKVGKEVFRSYMKNYGIGERTMVDLPGEIKGLASNLDSPREVENATASFGQGIAITPIAAVRALSVLANGGNVITPHVTKQINYTFGLPGELSTDPVRRVLKETTSDEITRMLVEVVDKALLGGTVKNPSYSIAAKTGTAQIADPSGGYYSDRYLHSFFGYFPAYDPKFLVFLYAINPKGEAYASHTLTEPFMNTANFLIKYYNIPPDRQPVEKIVTKKPTQ
jgi:cell division protein FtsI/penicillin-binding protein 2